MKPFFYERIEMPEGYTYREVFFYEDTSQSGIVYGRTLTEDEYHAIVDKASAGIVTGISTGVVFDVHLGSASFRRRISNDPF